jgi:hypothetical protein
MKAYENLIYAETKKTLGHFAKVVVEKVNMYDYSFSERFHFIVPFIVQNRIKCSLTYFSCVKGKRLNYAAAEKMIQFLTHRKEKRQLHLMFF